MVEEFPVNDEIYIINPTMKPFWRYRKEKYAHLIGISSFHFVEYFIIHPNLMHPKKKTEITKMSGMVNKNTAEIVSRTGILFASSILQICRL